VRIQPLGIHFSPLRRPTPPAVARKFPRRRLLARWLPNRSILAGMKRMFAILVVAGSLAALGAAWQRHRPSRVESGEIIAALARPVAAQPALRGTGRARGPARPILRAAGQAFSQQPFIDRMRRDLLRDRAGRSRVRDRLRVPARIRRLQTSLATTSIEPSAMSRSRRACSARKRPRGSPRRRAAVP
jgi:hypothetical protein